MTDYAAGKNKDEDIATALKTSMFCFDLMMMDLLTSHSIRQKRIESSEREVTIGVGQIHRTKIYQQDFPIYDGRYNVKKPVETTAPPNQLFHPIFGHFLDDLANDLPVPLTIAKGTVRYMRAASGKYDSEENRKLATDLPFREILGMGTSRVANADRMSLDGLIGLSLTGDTRVDSHPTEEG
jgi:hypothetical protein